MSIDGVVYSFRVDRYGRGIRLAALVGDALPDRPSLQPGSPLPEISLTDTDGQPHPLSSYRGKVLLLDFWAVWCAPCRAEAPRLTRIYERFHDRGLAILGINSGDSESEIKRFVAEFGMTWPQVMEAPDGPLHGLFRIRGWPTYFVVGKDGTILANHIDWESLDGILESALRE
ncbi:MAG: TlpA family protein disulfide reductase [Acidobacteriota bacterium]